MPRISPKLTPNISPLCSDSGLSDLRAKKKKKKGFVFNSPLQEEKKHTYANITAI